MRAGSHLGGVSDRTGDIDMPSAFTWPDESTIATTLSIKTDIHGITHEDELLGKSKNDAIIGGQTSSFLYGHVYRKKHRDHARYFVNTFVDQAADPVKRFLAEPMTAVQQGVVGDREVTESA